MDEKLDQSTKSQTEKKQNLHIYGMEKPTHVCRGGDSWCMGGMRVTKDANKQTKYWVIIFFFFFLWHA